MHVVWTPNNTRACLAGAGLGQGAVLFVPSLHLQDKAKGTQPSDYSRRNTF
jgi:hypothetical protein